MNFQDFIDLLGLNENLDKIFQKSHSVFRALQLLLFDCCQSQASKLSEGQVNCGRAGQHELLNHHIGKDKSAVFLSASVVSSSQSKHSY